MAENVLAGLIPSLFAGLDTVSRELVGFIPAVHRNATFDRVAVGQPVTYHVAPPTTGGDITPAMIIPEPTGLTIAPKTLTITKSRFYEFGFVGEAELGLNNNGAGANEVQADLFAQSLRGLTNEIELDLAVDARANVSRASGTVGVEPFAPVGSIAGDTKALTDPNRILSDNGAPISDRQAVLDTTAGMNIRTLWGINSDRDWSKRTMNQQGVLETVHGIAVRETGQSSQHTAGSASGATTNAAGYAAGAITITLASAGTGTILPGDVITFDGDSEQYVVVTGSADVSAGGTVVIQEPGLREAIPTSATDITVIADHGNRGVIFYRNAIILATRAPALPQGGDAAAERFSMQDPRSGMVFEVSVYRGYRKVRFEVAAAWGTGVTQPRHTSLLLA